MKTIKSLGEFRIIERIRRKIKSGYGVIQGIGDDAAVIRPAVGVQLVTSDAIVDGIDFLRKKTPPALVGRKLLAINLSDIAAMGGIPKYVVLTLGLIPEVTITWMDQFMDGFVKLARQWHVNLIGGDISRSKTLWASATVLGEAPAGKWISRSGAQIGDRIYVTGTLGGSLRGKHLSFTPRIKEAQEIVKKFRPTSMIDISDGLLQDLGHILEESKVGAKLDLKAIPISRGTTLEHALKDGEDFELLFTSPKKIQSKNITYIGDVVPKSKNQVRNTQTGYVHF